MYESHNTLSEHEAAELLTSWLTAVMLLAEYGGTYRLSVTYAKEA